MNSRTSYFLHLISKLTSRLPSRKLMHYFDKATGAENINWSRVVMQRDCLQITKDLHPEKLSALEISGTFYGKMPFGKYKSVNYPEYDICSMVMPQEFDLVIAEQVFEHLLWPYRAGRNVYQMLNPGGYFLISTPFLVKIHNYPTDCTRWTETGLKYFLAECGFPLEKIKTKSWGNRACVIANFEKWERYRQNIHTLKNEPEFPYCVWALAQK